MSDSLIAISSPEAVSELESVWDSKDLNLVTRENDLWSVLSSDRKFSRVVVDSMMFKSTQPWDWIPKLKESCGKAKLWLLLSSYEDSTYQEIIIRICYDLQISVIPPDWTPESLPGDLLFYLDGRKSPVHQEGKLVTLFSASPKDGATTVALSLAIALAKYTDKTVGLLDLNLKSPEIRDHMRLKGDKGFPMIQTDCDTRDLDSHGLMKACENHKSVKNLFILTGIQRREWSERISNGEVDYLLEVARSTFDITIVDVHTFPDQAATVRAIKGADERLVVSQPVLTSFQSSWQDWFRSVWAHYELKESDFKLIVNREQSSFINANQMSKNMGISLFGSLPNVGKGLGIYSVNYGEPMFLSEDEETNNFKLQVFGLAKSLAEAWEIGIVENHSLVSKRPTFWKKFFPMTKAVR